MEGGGDQVADEDARHDDDAQDGIMSCVYWVVHRNGSNDYGAIVASVDSMNPCHSGEYTLVEQQF